MHGTLIGMSECCSDRPEDTHWTMTAQRALNPLSEVPVGAGRHRSLSACLESLDEASKEVAGVA